MYGKINEDGTFRKKFEVGYDEVDYNLMLKPQRATQICQNIAVNHSDAAGYTLDYFRNNHCGWALTGWHIIFNDRPKENQTFEITTWTKPFKRLQADRSFIVSDINGDELFRAESRWFLMDTQRRRPKKLPPEFFDSYIPATLDNAILDEDYKHPSLELYELQSTRDFIVTRRDIDANNHTNNVAYIEWAIDDLTDDLYFDCTISELRADYSKEAMFGDTVRSHYYRRELNDGRTEVTSVFTPADDSEHMLCRITTIWKQK